jgi:nucleoside-diphosphate-sugar epimerase
MIKRFKNVLVIGHNNKFEKLMVECFSPHYTVHTKVNMHNLEEIKRNNIDVIVFDALNKRKELKKEIQVLSELPVQKIVYLEDASQIYVNSKNIIPYSVYKKVIPKNRRCARLRNNEEKLLRNKAEVVIFRISEMFGPHVNYGAIHDLLNKNHSTLLNGKRDFIYEGDVIHAIEVALETDAMGIYDIASGRSIRVKDDLIDLINKYRHRNAKVKFRRKRKVNLVYNCENFKFYKWAPLVTLESGLAVINKSKNNLGGKNEKVQTSRN